jgi:F0F1-type ATP synthase delta subunit
MQNKKISSRYALSLLDLTEEKNNLDIVYQDARFIVTTLDQNIQLKENSFSPVIKPKLKVSIFDEIFKGRSDEELLRFIRFILRRTGKNISMIL